MKPIQQEIDTWLKTTQRHLDELETSTLALRLATRRLEASREALEEASAEYYNDGSIQGRNKEERDAALRHLVSKERSEYLTAKETHHDATLNVERLRILLSKDRQIRYALQMRVELHQPDQPLPTPAASNAPISAQRRQQTPHNAQPMLQFAAKKQDNAS